MYKVPEFIEEIVKMTQDYLFDMRHETPEFKRWFDEEEMTYKAQFSYGRIGEGSEIQSTMAAVANILTAIHEDGL